MDVLAKNLRKRARELELSDAEVARRAGLGERRYGHYVSGIREPNLETLVNISTVLRTTPNELLGFETEKASGKDSPKLQERNILTERLIAASDALKTSNLLLAVNQTETLLQHQRSTESDS